MTQLHSTMPGVFHPNMIPGMHSQATMGASSQSIYPPPPPLFAVPRDLRKGAHDGVYDIRDEKDHVLARNLLSTYFVIQIRPASSLLQYDEAGYPLGLSWEKVVRTEQEEMSQQDIRRKIRQLQETTKPVDEKKTNYPSGIQKQLERTLQKLTNSDPNIRYGYQLVQVESQWSRDYESLDRHIRRDGRDERRKSSRGQTKYLRISESSKSSKGSRSSGSSRSFRSSRSSKRGSSEPRAERVAVTAYFKRSPTSSQDPIQMLREKSREQKTTREDRAKPPFQQSSVTQPHTNIHQAMPHANTHQAVPQMEPPRSAHTGAFVTLTSNTQREMNNPAMTSKHQQPMQKTPSHPGVPLEQRPHRIPPMNPRPDHRPAVPATAPPAKSGAAVDSHPSVIPPAKVGGASAFSSAARVKPGPPLAPDQLPGKGPAMRPNMLPGSNQPFIKGSATRHNMVPVSNQVPTKGPAPRPNMLSKTLPAQGPPPEANIAATRAPQANVPQTRGPANGSTRANTIGGPAKPRPAVVTVIQERLEPDDSSSTCSDDDWSASEDDDTDPSSHGSVRAFPHNSHRQNVAHGHEGAYHMRRTHKGTEEEPDREHRRGRKPVASVDRRPSSRSPPMERRERSTGRSRQSRRQESPRGHHSARRGDSIPPRRTPSRPQEIEEVKWSSRRPEPNRFRQSVRIVRAPSDSQREFRDGRDDDARWQERNRLNEAVRNRTSLEKNKHSNSSSSRQNIIRSDASAGFKYDDDEARYSRMAFRPPTS